jgi:hypothetical protein
VPEPVRVHAGHACGTADAGDDAADDIPVQRAADPGQASSPPWIRGHWKIENCLHWVATSPSARTPPPPEPGTGPYIMAAIRDLVISILRLAGIVAALRHVARDPARPLRLLTGRK